MAQVTILGLLALPTGPKRTFVAKAARPAYVLRGKLYATPLCIGSLSGVPLVEGKMLSEPLIKGKLTSI